ncbi:DNA-directed RNA polymerase III subunit RPC10 [Thecamonas trahens ATCC 50062]|uniref:DNA-directed RNA polymerase subunit n=1 Tax=Thecamonas trahens ATCC 50062 TaxID=461836 RepID=A0A0L0DC89_THETB|nr:DNA-directed RNA polymerase III subunit RPC10 [Thecamonas trahens ATCC 50062]KNC48923.1 DNA-directed RNA polymerase III subunit RPC10 [Thecamonas trahens ATCC 50062]|eukprot:XP_013758340.1 DNA-directed RNA polymerase III subunit RPC10 [Thecamonas trahens ATCC 50062]
MLFCPTCANMLVAEDGVHDGGMAHATNTVFVCRTCTYVYHCVRRYTEAIELTHKEVDDVLGDSAWENVGTTQVDCEKCDNNQAYFMTIQIRSADEPMTEFYKCSECGHQWRNG